MDHVIALMKDYKLLCIPITLVWLSIFYNPSYSQVENDNIENRIQLVLNKLASSSTTDCTLQWKCLNQRLTAKCIQYHNDQWYYFRTGNQDKYYLNISGQDCRDLRGVQLVIIDGEPCEPESYKILKCISLGTQNDVFVELDSLENQKEYMVLIDGYLHDFCSFNIEFSDKPKGLPLEEEELVNMEIKPAGENHVKIYWSIPDTIANELRYYEVYRRHESKFKSRKIHEVNQGFNAYGTKQLDYVCEDILPDYGKFYYKVIGVGDHGRIFISKISIQNKKPKSLDPESKYWLELELQYPDACKLKIAIYDAKNYSLLNWHNFNYTLENSLFETYIKDYIDEGIFFYRIEVINLDTKERINHLIQK